MNCPYRREIHDAHVAIRAWLAGEAPADALDALMARFAEDFSMVTPHGAVLDKTALGSCSAARAAPVRGCASRSTARACWLQARLARPWSIGKSSPTRRVAASACPP